jgi:hypothetical protein
VKRSVLPTALASLGLVAAAQAQATIVVNADIATSTTWTANNIYNLASQIYVLPGATLTIEPGTVIASTANAGGSLCVTRGAQIFVNGTERNPVIMTSDADRATWVGGDPKTGTWRAACNEWGNLTICGRGYVSENLNPATNTATPNAANYGTMEGLTPAFPGDTRVYYGGGNDDDDSGNISYLSLRYGGKVVALTNELNGLSMGGVGRGTDVHHVEIMNNVDDGIEVWGGTVNFKHLSIWNVGDDSFDVDQGWRGRAQFGLIVQGYSVPASQGSGWGDNAIEMDGAEQSDYQPVTTATIYNFTVIGCPTTPVTGGTGGTDHGIALRDNARVQFRNCIFTDIGERVLSFDNTDGDGGAGLRLQRHAHVGRDLDHALHRDLVGQRPGQPGRVLHGADQRHAERDQRQRLLQQPARHGLHRGQRAQHLRRRQQQRAGHELADRLDRSRRAGRRQWFQHGRSRDLAEPAAAE